MNKKQTEMETEKRYQTLFYEYDQEPLKPVSEQQLGHQVLELTPDPTIATDLEKAELFAFQFVENYRNKDEREAVFYKPHRSQPLPGGGERVYPDITEVTVFMMQYWQHRAEFSTHPILKARYAGLVYEFSLRVSGQKVSHKISIMFAKALLDTVKQNLIEVFAYKTEKLKKALSVALKMNNINLVNEVKDTILQLEESVPMTETKNFWTFSFDLLLNVKKKTLSDAEETALINRLQQRFIHFLAADSEAAWEAATRLCSYYHAKQDKNKVLQVLTELEMALLASMEGQPVFQRVHGYERLHKSFDQYGFRVKAIKLLTLIRKVSRNAESEMNSVSGSATVSQADIDILVNRFLQFQGDQLFVTLAIHFSLNEAAIHKEVETSAKQNSRYFLLTKDLLDAKGRKIGILPSYTDAPEPYITREAEFQIKYNALFFCFIMDEGVKRGIITTSEMIKFVKLSAIFEEANIAVIERAFSYYMLDDYLAFIHIIIPQLEEAIRNLVETSGGNVLIAKDNNTYMLKTFEHLLNEPITVSKLGISNCLHFRTLLTDKTGMNLRNDVAHGIIHPDKFDVQNANSLIIALLILVLNTVPE